MLINCVEPLVICITLVIIVTRVQKHYFLYEGLANTWLTDMSKTQSNKILILLLLAMYSNLVYIVLFYKIVRNFIYFVTKWSCLPCKQFYSAMLQLNIHRLQHSLHSQQGFNHSTNCFIIWVACIGMLIHLSVNY